MARADTAQAGARQVLRLVWTRPAHEDRKAIREYIGADNPRAALDLDELLSAKAARLLDHPGPGPGPGRAGRIAGTRELVAHGNFILSYDVSGGDVRVLRVLRVLHVARQWPPTRT